MARLALILLPFGVRRMVEGDIPRLCLNGDFGRRRLSLREQCGQPEHHEKEETS